MRSDETSGHERRWPKLALLPPPAKALITAVIFTMAIAMVGALGQIIVHDIIPTFFAGDQKERNSADTLEPDTATDAEEADGERGDLFASPTLEEKPSEPFYKTEQFVWTLKWTHIHVFGMSMIFIFMGAITLFLSLSARVRTWLIVLPFIGVFVDIAGVWLKGFISHHFFWLHIPGGVLFGTVFMIVSFRALWEMWWSTTGS